MPEHVTPNRWGLRFHHLGLSTQDADAAAAFLTGLGYEAGVSAFDPLQNVNLGLYLHPAMPAVEVITPAEGSGPLDALLAVHRDGLIYHACFTAGDLDAALGAIEAEGLRLFEVSAPKPAVLFGGKPVAFYVVGGVGLIEIIDDGASTGRPA